MGAIVSGLQLGLGKSNVTTLRQTVDPIGSFVYGGSLEPSYRCSGYDQPDAGD